MKRSIVLLALSALGGCVSAYHRYEERTYLGDNLLYTREVVSRERCQELNIVGRTYRITRVEPNKPGHACSSQPRDWMRLNEVSVVTRSGFDRDKLGNAGTIFEMQLVKGPVQELKDSPTYIHRRHPRSFAWKPEYLLEQKDLQFAGQTWVYAAGAAYSENVEIYSLDLGDGYHLTAGAWYFPPVNEDPSWFAERRALVREMVESIRVERLE
jgi:hypothetical protein